MAPAGAAVPLAASAGPGAAPCPGGARIAGALVCGQLRSPHGLAALPLADRSALGTAVLVQRRASQRRPQPCVLSFLLLHSPASRGLLQEAAR